MFIIRKSLMLLLSIFIIITLTACNNENSSPADSNSTNPSTDENASKRVFSELYIPSTTSELELWLSEIEERIIEEKSKIILAKTYDWDSVIKPYIEIKAKLSDDISLAILLMTRSSDLDIRDVAYFAYAKITQYVAEVPLDKDISFILDSAYSQLNPKTNEQQNELNRYLKDEGKINALNLSEKESYLYNLQQLTNISLQYYQNTMLPAKTLI
ncbi:MAG: hypothetical protein DRG78_17640, partial [Epsilonproteobacteria bacterium]